MSFLKKVGDFIGLGGDAPKTDVLPPRFHPFTVQDGPKPPKENATFLGALGKLGKIEALSGATKGLNVVLATANAGGPGLTNLINSGGAGVLNVVTLGSGLGPGILNNINKINPSAVNVGIANGNKIVDDLKEGKFTAESIPKFAGAFSQVIGVGLQIMKGFGKKPVEPPEKPSMHNYALDMIEKYGGVKFPFRFLVEFKYRAGDDAGGQDFTFMDSISPAFIIKTCDRPQVDFDAEDINMYNIRTKIIKKTTFNPVNMSFYDDQLSHVLSFCNMYLNLVSPTTNYNNFRNNTSGLYEESDEFFYATLPNDSIVPEGGTLKINFNDKVETVNKYSASFAAMAENATNQSMIEEINVYHIYQGGAYCDIYTLVNPKIIQMQFDQLNMAGNDGNAITLQWHYDSFSIQTFVQVHALRERFDKIFYKFGIPVPHWPGMEQPTQVLAQHATIPGVPEPTPNTSPLSKLDKIKANLNKISNIA